MKKQLMTLFLAVFCLLGFPVFGAPLVYQGQEGIGQGKHIVFIANDHEYRSEETCPLLAKLLAKHHGFKCTVLFGLDEQGFIAPGANSIPDLDVLKDADLLVFFTRFMSLSDAEVQHIVDYLEAGKPIVGMRTSTHCFNKQGGSWGKLNFNYSKGDYRGGLGEQVFGNTWNKGRGQSHYGKNHGEGGTYSAVESAKNHPVMIGVEPFHAYSGAYKSQPPSDATPLIEVQVLKTFETSDTINAEKEKVNAGWTRDYYIAPSSGETKNARVFYTSVGASEDLLDKNTRRFLMNGCLWTMGMEKSISADSKVDLVGPFEPSAYSTGLLYRINVKPSDLAGFESAIMPNDSGFAGVVNGKISKKLIRPLSVRPKLVEKIQSIHPNAKLPVKKSEK